MHQISYIKNKLKEYKKKFYLRELVNGLILFFSILTIAFLLITTIELFGNFNTNTRTILFFTFLIISGYALVKHLGIPIKKLINNDKELTDIEASEQIGKLFPDIKDKLLNTIQLSSLNNANNDLIAASIEQRSKELSPFVFQSAITFDKSKNLLIKYLSIPLVVFVLLFLFNRKSISQSTERIVNFNKEYVPAAPFEFQLINQKLEGFTNENFKIELSIQGNSIPEQVSIQTSGGSYLMQSSNNTWTYTFYNLDKSQNFRFEAAGFVSGEYNLNIFERPSLQETSLTLDYPKYLNKKNEDLQNLQNLKIPEGTTVNWKFNSKSTNKIVFTFNDSTNTELERKSENDFEYKKQFLQNSNYNVELINDKSKNPEPINYRVEVIKDKFPGIDLENFSDTILYNYILIGGNVYDDYGLKNLKLYYNIYNSKNKKSNTYNSINIPIKRGKNSQNFAYQFQLDTFDLKPGDKIDYFVKVWDNDGINGSKSTKSQTKNFAVPSEKEIDHQQNANAEKNQEALSKTMKESQDLNEELKKLSDKFKTKKKLSWQDKKDIEKVIQKQREVKSKLEKLQKEIQMNQEQNKRFNEVNPEVEEKMQQLQKLMENIVDEETQKLMEELQKLLEDDKNINDINKKLEELNQKEDNFEKELDRTIEMYKQLEFEQKMDKTIDKLEKLSKEQEDLSEQTKNSKNKEELNDINKQQEELKEKFEDINKEMEKLNEMNEELENKHDLEELKPEQNDVEQNMDNAQEQLQNQKKNNASQSQKNAAEQMKKMASKMSAMKQSQQAEMLQENIDDLRNILDNLITLSFEQERVLTQFKKARRKDPRFVELSQEQLKIEQDSKIIEDSLYALAKRVFQLEQIITKELANMKKYLSSSTEYIKMRNSNKAASKQQYAMTSMNNLALLLDDLLDNLQQQMAQQSKGNQMCNKPGNNKGKGKGKPNISDMQKSLNDMIKKLKAGQKAGKQMSSELAKMAAKQEMLRRELKKLEQSNGKLGEKGKLSKELQELSKAMKETENDLLNKNLNEKTIKRQQEILSRLLEAENASKEKGLDNKREAKESKTTTISIPPSYEKYIKLKQKQIELLQTIPTNLNPYYKREVNEYFDKIDY